MKRRWACLCTILVLLISLGTATLLNSTARASPAVVYVDADASGSNDGTSWADAYNHLQDALSAAVAGDEIWLAEGTYRPDEDAAHPAGTDNRLATFQLVDGVALYGGFAGGETTLEQRNWETNQTILTGDLAGDDGPDFANNDENSYHVVIGSGVGSTAVLDGMTVTAGNANGSGYYEYGGGMYSVDGGSTLTNCTFIGNHAFTGGGMHNQNSSPFLVKCSFSGNEAYTGGGMSNSSGSPTLTNCTFTANRADWGSGGGMYNWLSSPSLTDCTFIGNQAFTGGGMCLSFFGSPHLANCIFTGNHADGGGGGFFNDGFPNLANCTFSGNQAGSYGGGFYNASGRSLSLDNCILWGNCDSSGGGESAQIHMQGDTIAVDYSCVQGWTGALGGTGNIGDDPVFVDGDGPDGNLGTEDDNLRLSPGSPCVDTGDNVAVPAGITVDLDGNPRISDGDNNGVATVDMGAYEYVPAVWTHTFTDPRRGTELHINCDEHTCCFTAFGWYDSGIVDVDYMRVLENRNGQLIMLRCRDGDVTLQAFAVEKLDLCTAFCTDRATGQRYRLFDPPGMEPYS